MDKPALTKRSACCGGDEFRSHCLNAISAESNCVLAWLVFRNARGALALGILVPDRHLRLDTTGSGHSCEKPIDGMKKNKNYPALL